MVAGIPLLQQLALRHKIHKLLVRAADTSPVLGIWVAEFVLPTTQPTLLRNQEPSDLGATASVGIPIPSDQIGDVGIG